MKLRTKKGALTAYAFACGYVERSGDISLSKEHGCYHIKGYDKQNSRVWKSARTLSEARKVFNQMRIAR